MLKLAKLVKSQSGQALLGFALAIPLMLTVSLGVLEFGFIGLSTTTVSPAIVAQQEYTA